MRVLVTAYAGNSLGHLTRPMAVAERLMRRGHEVLFACSESSLDIPQSLGIPCKAVFELTPVTKWPSQSFREFVMGRMASPHYIETTLREETQLIQTFQPDVTLFDMRNTGVASALANVPSISIYNTNLFIQPHAEVVEWVTEQMLSMNIPKHAVAKIFGDYFIIPDFSSFEPMFRIPPGVITRLASSVKEMRHIGPILRFTPSDLPSKDELKHQYAPNYDLPLILISLGGGASTLPNLSAVLQGLHTIDANFIVVTGPNIRTEQVSPFSTSLADSSPLSHVTVIEYTAEFMHIMKAADVAVIHGGHSTLMEGIMCGTPLICVPGIREQEENSMRIQKQEFGYVLSVTELNYINSYIQKIMKDKLMAARCQRFARVFGGLNGAEILIDFMEAVVEIEKSLHPLFVPSLSQ